MLIEQQKRPERVRFRCPIRVVTVNDQPRVIRTLTRNLSREGLFLRMPEPLPMGTKVGLSLEAGGRALAFAQAEVMWQEHDEGSRPEAGPGCGVRFTRFMHPRAHELVEYLVDNLDRGKPLTLPGQRPLWARLRVPTTAAMAALFVSILGMPLLSALLAPELAGRDPAAESSTPDEFPEDSVPGPVEVGPVAGARAAEAVPVDDRVPAEPPAPAKVESAAVAAPAEDPPAGRAEPVSAVPAPPTEPSPVVAGTEQAAVAAPSPVTAGARAPVPLAPPSSQRSQGGGGAAKAKSKKSAPETGTVKLPGAAAPALSWTLTGSELRLAPELSGRARITRSFVLEAPPRAVFDISGSIPRKSLTVNASPPYATSVRLGKQAGGTRLVVDLDAAPRRSRKDDGALVLSF